MYFFQQLEEFIESIFSFIENSSNNQFVTELSILFSISIVLFIMLKGYMVLAGKSQDPIRELAWDILVKMLIITFALNLNGWCTAVTESMEAINSWAGGGVSLYAELDKLLDATVNLQNAISDRGNIVSSFFYGLIVYIAFLIGVIPTLFVVITTTFTLKILIMLAPIMFFVLFYGWLKNMFTQWLSLFLSNTLTILILGLILSSIINTFRDYQIFLINRVSNIDPFLTTIQVLIIGFLLYVLVKVGVGVAEKIATVSMENIMSSSFGEAFRNSKKTTTSSIVGLKKIGRINKNTSP